MQTVISKSRKAGRLIQVALSMATQMGFVRAVGNVLTLHPSRRHEFHVAFADTVISRMPTIADDPTGKKTSEALLEAAAHLKVAADKVLKEQEKKA